jgi:hypothetical protein
MADHTIFLCLPQFYTFIAEIDDKQKKIGYDSKLRQSARTKSGGPSLGRSPARTSSVTPPIKDKIQKFGEIGSTRFSEQGCGPALFFSTIPEGHRRPFFQQQRAGHCVSRPNSTANRTVFMDS